MWHIVVWNSRLTTPLILRFRKDKGCDLAWTYLQSVRSGQIELEDECGTTLCMAAADLAGYQRIETAKDMEAKIEEAVAQHRAQARAQTQAQQMAGGAILSPRGMM